MYAGFPAALMTHAASAATAGDCEREEEGPDVPEDEVPCASLDAGCTPFSVVTPVTHASRFIQHVNATRQHNPPMKCVMINVQKH